MSSSVNSRTSVADLRRRLQTSPNATIPVATVVPEPVKEPVLPPALARRLAEATRTIGAAPVPEAEVVTESPRQVGRRTPLPGAGLEANHFLRPKSDPAADLDGLLPGSLPLRASTPEEEIAQLRALNAQLRQTLEEVQPILEEAQANEVARLEREQKLENELGDRELQLEQLRAQVKQLETELANRPILKNADELAEWEDELEREGARVSKDRKLIDEERRQLQDDEDALEKQMREMEVSMARERAMMARQETELKRLSAEIHQELEQMGRGDAGLREQMVKFQRRHQEVLARAAGMPVSPAAVAPVAPPAPAKPEPSEAKKGSSLFNRIFRK